MTKEQVKAAFKEAVEVVDEISFGKFGEGKIGLILPLMQVFLNIDEQARQEAPQIEKVSAMPSFPRGV